MQPQSPAPGRFVGWLGSPSRVLRDRKAIRSPLTILCLVLAGVMILWDVWLAVDDSTGNTWSEVTHRAGRHYPVLPWLFGALLAHLYHPNDNLRPRFDRDAASTVMGMLTFALLGLGWVAGPFPRWSMLAFVGLGVICALLLWPKHRTGAWRW